MLFQGTGEQSSGEGTGDATEVGGQHVQQRMYAAMLALQVPDFELAEAHIGQARRVVAPILSTMLDEHYNRAYAYMVTVQQLAELEEIVRYRR